MGSTIKKGLFFLRKSFTFKIQTRIFLMRLEMKLRKENMRLNERRKDQCCCEANLAGSIKGTEKPKGQESNIYLFDLLQ